MYFGSDIFFNNQEHSVKILILYKAKQKQVCLWRSLKKIIRETRSLGGGGGVGEAMQNMLTPPIFSSHF
jgi:hypothetical protein